jgi:hypothetical protein
MNEIPFFHTKVIGEGTSPKLWAFLLYSLFCHMCRLIGGACYLAAGRILPNNKHAVARCKPSAPIARAPNKMA